MTLLVNLAAKRPRTSQDQKVQNVVLSLFSVRGFAGPALEMANGVLELWAGSLDLPISLKGQHIAIDLYVCYLRHFYPAFIPEKTRSAFKNWNIILNVEARNRH